MKTSGHVERKHSGSWIRLIWSSVSLRPYKLIEKSRSVRGMGWLQLGEDVGGVE